MIDHYNKPFVLKGKIGNNAFSYDKRKVNDALYISRIEKSDCFNIKKSDMIAFSEIDNNKEYGFKGIDPFLLVEGRNKNIYVFDNHNHAFYFIYKEIYENRIPSGLDMIHIDQHKDTRTPELSFSTIKNNYEEIKDFLIEMDYLDEKSKDYKVSPLDAAFYYTNAILNVGNFINPLTKEKLINNLYIVDSTYTLAQIENAVISSSGYILDIDLDFFSEDMEYIEESKKISTINTLAKKASLITICTSPFFIDFDRAKSALGKLNLI